MFPEVVLAPTIPTFENRLDKFGAKQDVKYDFETTLNLLQLCIATGTADKQDQDLNIAI